MCSSELIRERESSKSKRLRGWRVAVEEVVKTRRTEVNRRNARLHRSGEEEKIFYVSKCFFATCPRSGPCGEET